MARDPLRVLLSLRRHAAEAARYALAACLDEEAAIAARIAALDDAMRRDRDTAAGWDEAYRFLEFAPLWRDACLADRLAMAADADAAAARSQAARDRVAAARTACESVGQVMAEREAGRQTEAIRREQLELDDIARGIRANPRTPAGRYRGGARAGLSSSR